VVLIVQLAIIVGFRIVAARLERSTARVAAPARAAY
jgi:hypothetical protein